MVWSQPNETQHVTTDEETENRRAATLKIYVDKLDSLKANIRKLEQDKIKMDKHISEQLAAHNEFVAKAITEIQNEENRIRLDRLSLDRKIKEADDFIKEKNEELEERKNLVSRREQSAHVRVIVAVGSIQIRRHWINYQQTTLGYR